VRRLLPPLLLALLTASIWAPSSALAALDTVLSAPSASPLIGTTETVFKYSVHYSGTAGGPAASLRVDAANMSIGLHLASGTRADGTWTGSSLLPSGTWLIRFSATLSDGSASTLDGPIILVSIASSTPSNGMSATASGGPAPTARPFDAPSSATPTATPKLPTMTQAPKALASGERAPASVPPPSGGNQDPQPSATPHGWSRAGASAPSQGGHHGYATAASPKPARQPAAKGSASTTAEPAPGPGRGGFEDPQATLSAALALCGMAVLACLALLLARRRRQEESSLAVPRGARAQSATTLEGRLEARTRAAARTRAPADDPILTAMGLGPDAPAAQGARNLRAKAPRAKGQVRGGRPSEPRDPAREG
jgi:hypothetical protein